MASPAYMTITFSQVWATTPRSWVIRIMAVFSRFCSSLIRPSICAWMVTSRAVVGSSARISLGSQARAMAITIRCFMPPLNWCGYSSLRLAGMPTSSIISSTRASSWARLCSGWWMRSTSMIWAPTVITGLRADIGSWKIMDTTLPRILRMFSSLSWSISTPSSTIDPPVTKPMPSGSSWMMLRAVVVLPAPVSPTSPSDSPYPRSRSRPLTA